MKNTLTTEEALSDLDMAMHYFVVNFLKEIKPIVATLNELAEDFKKAGYNAKI